MKFKHFILTRFNLGLYSTNEYKIKDPDKWMEHRIKLFEEITFKSMKAQTCQDATWILAFDPLTPKKIIQKYDYCDHIQVCFEQPHLYLRDQQPETDWIITTRLDNDDELHPEFIETIQNEFMERLEVIDFDYNKVKYPFKTKYPSNRTRANSPFLSLVEPWDEDITTALGHPHSNMPDLFPSRKINKTLSIMVIHSMNVKNEL